MNKAANKNSEKSKSGLQKKKSSSVAYNYIREGCAMDLWRTTYVSTKWNPSDILTKVVSSITDRIRKIRMLLYDIYPEDKD